MLNPPKELNLWIVVILMVIASAYTSYAAPVKFKKEVKSFEIVR